MASLFTNSKSYDRTSVVQLDDGTTYLPVKIIPYLGKEINNDSYPEKEKDSTIINALVSSFNIHWGTRTQFSYTLSTDIYAYTFGENMDELIISGIGFRPCTVNDERNANKSLEDLIHFWEINNIGEYGWYCTIKIGTNIYKAYLVEGEIGATDQVPGIFPFKFTFNAILIE